uniref:Uncharacterized protein MANES_08G158500 n=1 Tax=Rhizophora mucronata TaxID=61149 RepID=A0A2P2ISI8_RHIMU
MTTTYMWRSSYILSSARSTHPTLLFRQPLTPPTFFQHPVRHFLSSFGISFPVLKATTTNASFWWSSGNGSTTMSQLPSNYVYRKLLKLGFGRVGSRRFTTGATHVNDPGSIDSPLIQSMEKKIKEELNADLVIVKDADGDGRHVSIYVVSSAFEGQSTVNRQRMVYKAIWEELQNTVHAVDLMTTRTPSEAEGARK